jgi:tetratricopeptide (TPR) repeat protein
MLDNIGILYVAEGRYAEAEAALRKAVQIQEKLGGDARRDFSVTLHNLALAYSKQGRHAEALDASSRAFAIREAELPNADSILLDIMRHKAELLRKAHRKAEAVKLERTARQIKAVRTDEDPHQWLVDFRELQSKK